MKIIGKTIDGETMLAFNPDEAAALASAVMTINSIFGSPVTGRAVESKSVPAAKAAAPKAEKPKPAAEKPRHGCGNRLVKACKKCGAPRDGKTPWPKAGGICRACMRKIGMEKNYAKHGKKAAKAPRTVGLREKIDRDLTVAKAQKRAGVSGPDRIRDAMSRITENDRPTEGGRVLPILND